ncbi:hypothetical protein [Nonomuraea sp. KM88]|uniref:hypothetical protein n=1 Tax=Nonomuraea sp. KM88 TaxID=3457427 RepID=UPI003FCE5BC9
MYAMIWRYDTGTGSFDEMIKQVDREFADRIPEEVGSVLCRGQHGRRDCADGHLLP